MQKEILYKLRKALEELQSDGVLSSFSSEKISVEKPKDEQFGEYTSNAALVLSKEAKRNPLELADLIVAKLRSEDFEKVEIIKPGYINFRLSSSVLQSILENVLKEKENYGNDSHKEGKINNEFISANPTGPLHLGNARGGFYADTLSRVLRKRGYDVVNEYYVNDAGEQIWKLGHSVKKDEEAVYGGEYIEELAAKFAGAGDVETIGKKSAVYVLDEMIKKTLREKMQVIFDEFVSEENDVIKKGYVERAIHLLKDKGLVYESEGAFWLKTTEFGDDKDRVLIKQDGTKTYFASDCGYLLSKKERGFTEIIETWGADHHGYIARFKAAAKALGTVSEPRFIIVQLVKLVKEGVEVRMSKRAGNVVTIDDLIERVGHDVARFFFLMYAPETHMSFDLGLAEEHSQKNPVFYVQYAHARLCSILRKGKEEGFSEEQSDLSLLTHQKERELIRELMYFPEILGFIAEDFGVHRLPQYVMRLADKLHSYYDECRVLDTENKDLTLARLHLIRGIQVVLKESLLLMGISAPEKM